MQRYESTAIMHRAVEHNGMVFLGGVTAVDLSQDMAGQARQIFQRIDERLALADTDKTRLLSVTIYLTDLSMKSVMNEAWSAWLSADIMPARTTVGVADLGVGVLAEVTATACTRGER